MPHQRCTVCLNTNCDAIDTALAGSGESIREIALRFGVSKSALERHKNHSRKKRLADDELARMDAEIRKLHHAETAARRRGEGALALRIAREIRVWHETRARAVAMLEAARPTAQEAITPHEALQLARSVIEAHLSELDVQAWLRGLLERTQPASASDAQDAAEPIES